MAAADAEVEGMVQCITERYDKDVQSSLPIKADHWGHVDEGQSCRHLEGVLQQLLQHSWQAQGEQAQARKVVSHLSSTRQFQRRQESLTEKLSICYASDLSCWVCCIR